MSKIVKNFSVSWKWKGDTNSLQGFNLAVCSANKNPLEEIISSAFVDVKVIKEIYTYTLNSVVLDKDIDCKIWVQAIYPNIDSDWVSTGQVTVTDDGNATIVVKNDTEIQDVINMAADNKITNQEKVALRQQWQEMVSEYLVILENATNILGAGNQYRDRLKNTMDALATYLNNGSSLIVQESTITGNVFPNWISNSNKNTITIDPTTYRLRFRSYYEAKADCLEAIKDESIGNISIGGNNLIRTNSDSFRLTGTDRAENVDISNNGVLIIKDKTKFANGYVWIHDMTVSKLDANKEYCFAIDVKTNETGNMKMVIDYRAVNTTVLDKKEVAIPNTNNRWERIHVVMPKQSNIDATNHVLLCFTANTATTQPNISRLEFRNLKVEEGNIPTAYTISPEELNGKIEQAQQDANDANNTLNNLTSDNTLTNIEKKTVNNIAQGIIREYSNNTLLAGLYGVSTTNYVNAYTNLYLYLYNTTNGVLANLSTNTTIDRNTFNNNFNTYYTARQGLLTDINEKMSEVEIGGNNVVLNSDKLYSKVTSSLIYYEQGITISKENATPYSLEGIRATSDGTKNFITMLSASNFSETFNAGDRVIVSLLVRKNDTTTRKRITVYIHNVNEEDNGTHGYQTTNKDLINGQWMWVSAFFKIPANKMFQPHIGINGFKDVSIARIKIERGTKPTEWTPNPKDFSNAIEQAQQDANDANNKLDEFSSDGKITSPEKKALDVTAQDIIREKPGYVEQAKLYGVSYSDYENKFNTLNTYLYASGGLLSDLNTTSNVNRTTLKTNFNNYYEARKTLLLNIENASKGLIDNIKVGGSNLLRNSLFNTSKYWDGVYAINNNDYNGYNSVTVQRNVDISTITARTFLSQANIREFLVGTKKGDPVTISGYVYIDNSIPTDNTDANNISLRSTHKTTGFQDSPVFAFNSSVPKNTWVRFEKTSTIPYNYEDTSNIDFMLGLNKNGKIKLACPKIELGSMATQYSPSTHELEELLKSAQDAANEANNKLDEFSSDGKLTPTEKKALWIQWKDIETSYPSLINQADIYGIVQAKNSLISNYNQLRNYLLTNPGVLSNLNVTSDITRTTLTNMFNWYYSARETLLKEITAAGKSNADNIQIGGTNLVLNSDFYNSVTSRFSKTDIQLKAGENVSVVDYIKGKEVCLSLFIKYSGATGGRIGFEINGTTSAGTQIYYSVWQAAISSGFEGRITTKVRVTSDINNIHTIGVYNQLEGTTGSVILGRPKLELGNRPTDWSASPYDVQTSINNSINGIKLGSGINYLLNTKWDNPYSNTKYWATYQSNLAIHNDTTKGRCLKVSPAANLEGGVYYSSNTTLENTDNNLETTQDDYILTFWIKSEVNGTTVNVAFERSVSRNVSLTTTWQRVVLKMTSSQWTSWNRTLIFYALNSANSRIFYISEPMLERGNKESNQWSPHVLDAYYKSKHETETAKQAALQAAQNAQNAANNAQTSANNANNKVDEFTTDNKLTAPEKKTLDIEGQNILKEYPELIKQAQKYSINTTNYTNNYNTLNSYLYGSSGVLLNLNATTNINRATMKSYFANYYTQRSLLLTVIADAAKTNADNIQIGGNNLIINSSFKFRDIGHTHSPNNIYNTWVNTKTNESFRYVEIRTLSPNTEKYLYFNLNKVNQSGSIARFPVVPGTSYIFSCDISRNSVCDSVEFHFLGYNTGLEDRETYAATRRDLNENHGTMDSEITGDFKRKAVKWTCPNNVNFLQIRIDCNSGASATASNFAFVRVARPMLEVANRPSNYSPSPLDEKLEVMGTENHFINSDFSYIDNTNHRPGWDVNLNGTLNAYGWGGYNRDVSSPSTGYHAHINNTKFSVNVYELTNKAPSFQRWLGASTSTSDQFKNSCYKDMCYVISFDMYSDTNDKGVYAGLYYRVQGETSHQFHDGYFVCKPTSINGWNRYEYMFQMTKIPDIKQYMSVYIYGSSRTETVSGTCYIKNVSLEIGTKSSGWKKSFLDIDREAQEKADTARKAAEAKAAEAKAAADAAAAAAKTANDKVGEFTTDGKITAPEKKALKVEMQAIEKEYPELLKQAALYSISTSAIATAYSNLTSYVNPLLSNLNMTSNVDRNTMNTRFATYYNERQLLLTRVADAAKQQYTNLTIGSNNLVRNSGLLENTEFWGVTSGVTRQTHNNQYPEICNNNYFNISVSGETANKWMGLSGEKLKCHNIQGKKVSASFMLWRISTLTLADNLRMEILFFDSTGNTRVSAPVSNEQESINAPAQKWTQIKLENVTVPSNAYYVQIFIWLLRNGNVSIANMKLEEGSKCTAWTPHAQDKNRYLITAEQGISTNKQTIQEIKTSVGQINITVGQHTQSISTLNGDVRSLKDWKQQAEIAIRPDSITQTVLNSVQYQQSINTAINDISISGTNLAVNSNLILPIGSKWTWLGNGSGGNHNGSYYGEWKGQNALILNNTGTGEAWAFFRIPEGLIKPGKKYTISMDLSYGGLKPTSYEIHFYYYNTNGTHFNTGSFGKKTDINNSEWKRVSFTTTIPNGTHYLYIRIDNDGSPTSGTASELWISHVQLEEGTKATGWSESPYDETYCKILSGNNMMRWSTPLVLSANNTWQSGRGRIYIANTSSGDSNFVGNKAFCLEVTQNNANGYAELIPKYSSMPFSRYTPYVFSMKCFLSSSTDSVRVALFKHSNNAHIQDIGTFKRNNISSVSNNWVEINKLFFLASNYDNSNAYICIYAQLSNAADSNAANRRLYFSDVYVSQGNVNTGWKINQLDLDQMSEEKVDNVKVGGINLLDGTRTWDSTYWDKTNNGIWSGVTSDGFVIQKHPEGSWQYLRYDKRPQVVANVEYTVSVMIRSVGGNNNSIAAFFNKGGVLVRLYRDNDRTNAVVDNTWRKYSATFKYTDTEINSNLSNKGNYPRIEFQSVPAGFYMETYALMLEEGNKVSTWAPSATDMVNPPSGGRNLIHNGSPKKGGWNTAGNGLTLNLVDCATAPHRKAMRCTYAGDGSGMHQPPIMRLEVGKTYSWSVYVRASTNIRFSIGSEQGGQKTCSLTTGFKRFTHTFVASDATYRSFIFYKSEAMPTNGYIEAHSLCLVEGTIPMEWSAPPEEFYTKDDVYNKNEIVSFNYQSGAQVQTTVNGLEVKINQSGGYNKLFNGRFDNPIVPSDVDWREDPANWKIEGGCTTSIGNWIQHGAGHNRALKVDWQPSTGDKYLRQRQILLKPGTLYTFSGVFYRTQNVLFRGYVDLITTNDYNNAYGTNINENGGSGGSIDLSTGKPVGSWYKVTSQFRTPSGDKKYYVFSLYYPSGTSTTTHTFYATNLMINEGPIEPEWSPNPNEIRQGETTITNKGVTVYMSEPNANGDVTYDNFSRLNHDGVTVVKEGTTIAYFGEQSLIPSLNSNVINASEVYADNVPRVNFGGNYYVDLASGNDLTGAKQADGEAAWAHPFKTITACMEQLGRVWIDENVHVYIRGVGTEQKVRINGFVGAGILTLDFALNCKLYCSDFDMIGCNITIRIDGNRPWRGTEKTFAQIVLNRDCNATEGFMYNRGCTDVTIQNICICGRGITMGSAIEVIGGNTMALNTEISKWKNAFCVRENAVGTIFTCCGGDVNNLLTGGRNGFLKIRFKGNNAIPNITNTSESSGIDLDGYTEEEVTVWGSTKYQRENGVIYPAASVAPPPPATTQKTRKWVFTSFSSYASDKGWTKSELIQGGYSGWNTGIYKGKMNLNTSSIKSACSGATNLSGRVRLTRSSSAHGVYGNATAHLYLSDGTKVGTASLGLGGGDWISLTSAHVTKIINGTCNHLYVYAGNGQSTYIKFNTSSINVCAIEISYKN